MRLQQRFVLTLCAIAVILIAPALYGLSALRELRQVAYNLSTRDAVGALALGRLQTAFAETDNAARIYLALATQVAAERAAARTRVSTSMARAEVELERLSEGGYPQVVAPAREAWAVLRAAVEREQGLIERGDVAAADSVRDAVVNPAFAAVDAALDPIGKAINQAGAEQVARAQAIAARALTTTLLALAAALALALAISGVLARSVLRPVRELRGGMAKVAEGDFESELHIPLDRPDEIGDLARSFTRMTEQLTELDRLKAEFVSVASHELKTPLSVIRGYVSLLRDGIYGDVPEEQQKVLASVADQTERLGRLIQQLLDISRFEAGGGRLEVKPIDFAAFLRDLASSFEVLAFQNAIDFQLELADPLPTTLYGDPDRLNEVVGNLLSNAFKFTPRKGQIRLCARPATHAGDEAVVIEVSDTGVGIPTDQLTRVFEKFYQVDNEAQPRSVGSGLGLAISREIVEGHGGTIGADSQVGEGTTFRVSLPIHATPTPH